MFCFSTLCPHWSPETSFYSRWRYQLIEGVDQTPSVHVWSIAGWELRGGGGGGGGEWTSQSSGSVLGRCVGRTGDFGLTYNVLGGGEALCFVANAAQSRGRAKNTFPLTLHRELSSGNIDILLQILTWQLLLLSKVKLIRSSRPTGRCLVHISTAWSPARVPAAAAAASQSE